MKPFLTVIALLAITLPGVSQGNNAPGGHAGVPAPYPEAAPAALSPLAQQASSFCPSLISRTESAVANGHTQYYYLYDCECMAKAIDYNTWNDSTAAYDGPKMPDSDAYVILGAISGSNTIEDAFSAIDANISAAGYSATAACYGK